MKTTELARVQLRIRNSREVGLMEALAALRATKEVQDWAAQQRHLLLTEGKEMLGYVKRIVKDEFDREWLIAELRHADEDDFDESK